MEQIEPYSLTRKDIVGSVGKGWKNIVSELFDEVKLADPECRVVQVKEKFGGLRFYVENVTNTKVYDLISEAEGYASETCEICSKPAHIQSLNGWLKCICNECKAKHQ